MTANKTFYNFEKIEERGQKKLKKLLHITINMFYKHLKTLKINKLQC